MPTSIGREDVQRLVAEGAALVEALPKESYEKQHLPGAINLPLRAIDRSVTAALDPGRRVVVYCWDSACDLGPRAAWRLESLGYRQVYEYRAGKADWLAAGLPIEGEAAGRATAATVARRDVPTCRLDESLRAVRPRVRAAGWNACVVVNEARIVLGLLRAAELGREEDVTIESAMRPGPSTLRPNVEIEEVAAFMAEHDLPNMPVTTSVGELVGLLVRDDVKRATRRRPARRRASKRPARARSGSRRPARRRRR